MQFVNGNKINEIRMRITNTHCKNKEKKGLNLITIYTDNGIQLR